MSVVYFSNRLYNLILLMKGLDKFIDETSGTDMFYLETGHIQNLILSDSACSEFGTPFPCQRKVTNCELI